MLFRNYDLTHWGDSYFDQIQNLYFCMFPSCAVLHAIFRTVFAFALGPFLPMYCRYFFPAYSSFKREYGKKKPNFKIGLKPTQKCKNA